MTEDAGKVLLLLTFFAASIRSRTAAGGVRRVSDPCLDLTAGRHDIFWSGWAGHVAAVMEGTSVDCKRGIGPSRTLSTSRVVLCAYRI